MKIQCLFVTSRCPYFKSLNSQGEEKFLFGGNEKFLPKAPVHIGLSCDQVPGKVQTPCSLRDTLNCFLVPCLWELQKTFSEWVGDGRGALVTAPKYPALRAEASGTAGNGFGDCETKIQ